MQILHMHIQYVQYEWLFMCVCVIRHCLFFSIFTTALPYETEMTGSYVISPLAPLQVSNLDRMSEDLSPVLPAIVWLSYRSSTAVSAKTCCHPPCCQYHLDLGICHTCWCTFENKDSRVQRKLQEALFKILTFNHHEYIMGISVVFWRGTSWKIMFRLTHH